MPKYHLNIPRNFRPLSVDDETNNGTKVQGEPGDGTKLQTTLTTDRDRDAEQTAKEAHQTG